MKKLTIMAALAASAASILMTSAPANAQEPFLGEIRTFGYNFCPRGWTPTNGQLLPISSNTALFSLLGTMFGGDGRTTFALPDLRGTLLVAPGQSPEGSVNYQLAERGSIDERAGSGGQGQGGGQGNNQNQVTQSNPTLAMTTCIAVTGIFPSRN